MFDDARWTNMLATFEQAFELLHLNIDIKVPIKLSDCGKWPQMTEIILTAQITRFLTIRLTYPTRCAIFNYSTVFIVDFPNHELRKRDLP